MPADSAPDSGEFSSENIPLNRMTDRLFRPVDIGLLVYFRVVFGGVMLWESGRYLFSPKIDVLFIQPRYLFKYFGFEWIHPWPGNGMYWHFGVLGVLALMIAIGACYRLATVLYFLLFTMMFLMGQSYYLNHFYLISIISGLMIFLPAHRALSVDAWLRPSIRSLTAPAWTLGLLRFQIAVPYVFGGIAKLNSDWLAGEPMRHWLYDFFGRPAAEPAVYLFAWGGMLFDLLIVPAILWRQTRIIALFPIVTFHLLNHTIFHIGIFPWMMLAATAVFFPAEWFRIPADWQQNPVADFAQPARPSNKTGTRQFVACLLVIWVLAQVLIPFRHWLYPGNPSWTEEGHRFAWHMKLRAKEPYVFTVLVRGESGTFYSWSLMQRRIPGTEYYDDALRFRAVQSNAIELAIDDPAANELVGRQIRDAATKPDMTLQLAQHLARRVSDTGDKAVGVYVTSLVRLNYRKPQPLIDDSFNLLNVERSLKHAPWILPLKPAPMLPPRR